MPSLVEQATTAAKAYVRNLVARTLTDEEVSARRSICNNCEHRDPVQDRCLKCGCYLSGQLASKINMAEEKCPVGKW